MNNSGLNVSQSYGFDAVAKAMVVCAAVCVRPKDVIAVRTEAMSAAAPVRRNYVEPVSIATLANAASRHGIDFVPPVERSYVEPVTIATLATKADRHGIKFKDFPTVRV
ncbi:hypothetical protein HN935_03735 [archaeon]|jgi:hypothetical protein|nr:hypothetical protein [archaeon]